MELNTGDSSYRLTRKMNAFQQMEVMSKLSPLLASGFGELGPLLVALRNEGLSLVDADMGRLLTIAKPISKSLSEMTEVDRRNLIETCLACVDRKRGTDQGWAPIWNRDVHTSMYDDINGDAFLMLRIMLFVLQETFRDFLPEALSSLLGAERPPTSSR